MLFGTAGVVAGAVVLLLLMVGYKDTGARGEAVVMMKGWWGSMRVTVMMTRKGSVPGAILSCEVFDDAPVFGLGMTDYHVWGSSWLLMFGNLSLHGV